MTYDQPLIEATLLRRYKRFLADVRLASGEEITVHCANTGAMTGCQPEHARVWLWDSQNPARKHRYSWEWVEVNGDQRVCINTSRMNTLAAEALHQGHLAAIERNPLSVSDVVREPKVEGGRLDFKLHDHGETATYIEVKSVTLLRDARSGLGQFPDAVTERGLKHVNTLMALRAQGHRAILVFACPHEGITRVGVADDIDPTYAQALKRAVASGVEVLAYGVEFSNHGSDVGMSLRHSLPLEGI